MRHSRILANKNQVGFYHVICRTSNRRFLLDENEKGYLLNFVQRSATFSGVELLTYAVMSNHVHLLVEVGPPRSVSDKELLSRMRALYGEKKYAKTLEEWKRWRELDGSDTRILSAKKALRKRLFNLSQFCKTFKELYAMGYNRRRSHVTSVWGGARFKSLLLYPDPKALLSVASYIDMNPVRAGVSDDARQYSWNGFGAAIAGDFVARKGLCSLIRTAYHLKQDIDWETAKKIYADCLGGEIPDSTVESSPSGGPAPLLPRNAVSALLRKKGRLDWKNLVRCRIRHFSDGLVLGPSEFIKARFLGKQIGSYEAGRKKNAVCKIEFCGTMDLFTPVRLRNGSGVTLPIQVKSTGLSDS